MELSELGLNRQLIKANQTVETQDSTYMAETVGSSSDVSSIASGNAATDINTGTIPVNTTQLAGTIPPSIVDISELGWTNTCVFSITDADTVSWTSGVFTSAKGVSYNISAGNTGNMTAKNYIYLDLNVSNSVYQKTTTQTAVLGPGKVLIAVCQNGTTNASYIMVEATQITADNIIVNSLSAISANLGTITAGTIIGTLIETSSGIGQRVVINESNSNSIYFYNANNTKTIDISNTSGRAIQIGLDSSTSVGVLVSSAVSGNGFYYTNTTDINSRGIFVELTNNGTNNSLPCAEFHHDGHYYAISVHSTHESGGTISDVSGTGKSYYVIHSSSSYAFDIEDTGTSSTAATVYISSSRQAPALEIYKSASGGNPTGIKMAVYNSTGNEYAFEFGGDEVVSAAVSGTQNRKIRILLPGGAVYYIPCYDA